jgi:hypothetical protein
MESEARVSKRRSIHGQVWGVSHKLNDREKVRAENLPLSTSTCRLIHQLNIK